VNDRDIPLYTLAKATVSPNGVLSDTHEATTSRSDPLGRLSAGKRARTPAMPAVMFCGNQISGAQWTGTSIQRQGRGAQAGYVACGMEHESKKTRGTADAPNA
jgi:hypothetical protein